MTYGHEMCKATGFLTDKRGGSSGPRLDGEMYSVKARRLGTAIVGELRTPSDDYIELPDQRDISCDEATIAFSPGPVG